MYWIYDIPNWTLFLLVVSFFSIVSLIGLCVTRPIVRSLVSGTDKYNDLVNYHFAAVGVLYGLTLGLIAVGTWQNFNDVDSKASKEANSIGALYRDLDGYPGELRQETEKMLRDYTKAVIEKEWPAHQKGQILEVGDQILEAFENRIMAFEPLDETRKIMHTEVIESLGQLAEHRSARLQSVNVGLPGVLWTVVLIGAAVNIGVTFLFYIERFLLHALLVMAFASTLGMLIFLTAAMDNPFRGEFSVSSDAFKYVLEHVIEHDHQHQ